MKAKDYDIITLHNIDTEDFIFEYDRSSGNAPYTIPAGEVRRFPRFLAEHALKHLIDTILTKRKEKTNNETLRGDLASQIVISEEDFQQPVVKSESDKLSEEVEKLNRPSDLEMILGKKKAESPVVPVTDVPKEAEENFVGLKDSDFVDTTDKDEPIVSPPVKPVPTRNEIYSFATNTLKMVIDEDTKTKFDKMKVEDLLQEIGDPREVINV